MPEPFIEANMVTSPELQRAMVARILAAGLPDRPQDLADALGLFTLPDGTRRPLFVRHAVDALLTDGLGHIVLITRLHPPGAGRLAIPGGFIDAVGGRAEAPEATARRELGEETGIAPALIEAAALMFVGRRRYDRPFDLRVAWNDFPDCPIRRGDIFMVSTQPVHLRTKLDLTGVALAAGDDATGARVVRMADIGPETLGIADQFEMVREAAG